MRKAVLLIGLFALALSASAQFKVHGNDNSTYYITSNNSGRNGYKLTTYGNGSTPIYYGGHFYTTSLGFDTINVGLRGHADVAHISVGVWGSSGSSIKSIGVKGDISNTGTGAGIFGTIYGGDGSIIPNNQKYAGFFHGNVHVMGNITASTTLQGALLGEASSSSGSSAGGLSLRSGSIASSLSGLNVTTYQKERPEMPEVTETVFGLDGDTLQTHEEPKPDIIDEQFYDKTHYALDADRLEEAFPDLVYVNKDGSKVINYMEMIPLLVQSINELSAEIEVLKGQTSERTAKKARSATDIQKSLSGNRLYQNTPNPFKEQTVIRFSLADDVQNAAICIFDMTGKTIQKLPVSSGMQSVSIGGYELGEGMFLYSLVVNGQEIDTKRMIISK